MENTENTEQARPPGAPDHAAPDHAAPRHGGARPGAGRKPKAEKYEPEISAAERRIADRLPELLEHEFALATGGAERVESLHELALSIVVDSHETNPSGVIVKTKKQLFPNAAPGEMVLVSRKVITSEPARAAIEYLVDRILGKPTQAVELSGPDGGDVPLPAHDLSRLSTDELLQMRGMLQKTVKTTHAPATPNDPVAAGAKPNDPGAAGFDGGGYGAGAAEPG